MIKIRQEEGNPPLKLPVLKNKIQKEEHLVPSPWGKPTIT